MHSPGKSSASFVFIRYGEWHGELFVGRQFIVGDLDNGWTAGGDGHHQIIGKKLSADIGKVFIAGFHPAI